MGTLPKQAVSHRVGSISSYSRACSSMRPANPTLRTSICFVCQVDWRHSHLLAPIHMYNVPKTQSQFHPAPFLPQPFQDSGYDVSGRDSRWCLWCSFACDSHPVSSPYHTIPSARSENKKTYKRQAAVPARRNLRLVRVDEDPGVSLGPTAAVARHDTVMRPPHRLLVDELDGGIRPGLYA